MIKLLQDNILYNKKTLDNEIKKVYNTNKKGASMIKRKTQKEQDFVRLNINLPRDLKERFITIAKANETDSSKLMRSWIKEYLAKNSQQKMEF